MQTFPTQGDSTWFVKDRFGLFIHWGLYALAARHEWVKSLERIDDATYDAKYFKHFDPDLYDPKAWAKAASDAGMRYFVVTTKHHEGFALWDSALTDYKAPKTPIGRDLLRPMVEAFRERDMRVGFYHSIIDWHHPDYVVDRHNHPRRDELPAHPDFEDDTWMRRRLRGDGSVNAGRDQAKYAKFLHGQVRELLTQFGQIDILWFDFSFPHPSRTDFSLGKGREAWQSEELYKMIRELQPKVLLTDRLDLDIPLSGGDFKTPEQAQPVSWVTIEHEGKQVPVVWEACQTFSGSWGYHRDEHSWRSPENLIQTLIDCVSKGGNLLLNVGPTGRGEFDERALGCLSAMGEWMRRHSRSIYGCTQAPEGFVAPPDCRLTHNPDTNRLYVHLFAWPYSHLHLTGKAFKDRVEYAQLLNDASEVKIGTSDWHAGSIGLRGDAITLSLPQTKPNVTVPVIELFLRD